MFGKPVIKMFGLNEIQDVSLPAMFAYDEYMFLTSLQMVGTSDNFGYFIFTTESSYETSSSSYPEKGPLYQIDLNSLNFKLIDSNVYQSPYVDSRYYFFKSENGQKLRYFKAQDSALLINELDFLSGAVRTIAQSSGSPDIVNVSEFGDSFYLPRSDLYIRSDGTSKSFTNSQSDVRLIKSGEIIFIPSNCLGPCEIEVIEPLSGVVVEAYTLPWSTQAFSRLGTQLLPDGSLLWIGASKLSLITSPSTSNNFPELENDASPVFRLSVDGNYQLIGVRKLYDLEFSNQYPISRDGRFILLKSPSSSAYFIYDAYENKEVVSMPEYDNWIYDYGSTYFYPEGILIQFKASTSEKEYTQFFSLVHYDSSETFYWEDPDENILFCPDVFQDGSISCWIQNQDLNYDLVRFRPTTQNIIYLIENVFALE